ncbi:hypothetical protein CH63R_04677 [Colletotrichum higginsianum IMI 349063]|uniref:Uncharacterized protein n=1 Tax=Colletotrichum higginsianum (strain IMI 349063) TaxID=759273 RepID=A0A1B7YJZ1_COLHI|nr:hypothetical protein CH63R_04677 [Colletotrichum higginsianum IMI 349063]OBR12381.1 hypothetical protein CH63R_04677 [Colletotrichum higginsianum IMI 349063]
MNGRPSVFTSQVSTMPSIDSPPLHRAHKLTMPFNPQQTTCGRLLAPRVSFQTTSKPTLHITSS